MFDFIEIESWTIASLTNSWLITRRRNQFCFGHSLQNAGDGRKFRERWVSLVWTELTIVATMMVHEYLPGSLILLVCLLIRLIPTNIYNSTKSSETFPFLDQLVSMSVHSTCGCFYFPPPSSPFTSGPWNPSRGCSLTWAHNGCVLLRKVLAFSLCLKISIKIFFVLWFFRQALHLACLSSISYAILLTASPKISHK